MKITEEKLHRHLRDMIEEAEAQLPNMSQMSDREIGRLYARTAAMDVIAELFARMEAEDQEPPTKSVLEDCICCGIVGGEPLCPVHS